MFGDIMSIDTGTNVGASVDLTGLFGSQHPWLVTTWQLVGAKRLPGM